MILLRYPTASKGAMGDDAVQGLKSLGDDAARSFVTLAPGRMRVGRLPV